MAMARVRILASAWPAMRTSRAGWWTVPGVALCCAGMMAVALAAPPDPADGEDEKVEAPAAPSGSKADKGGGSGKPPRSFRPTEQIGVDTAVAFPANI